MVEIDPNLVVSIWTGSVVPLVAVILYYWLFRRFELRRNAREERKRVYRKFLRIIDATIQSLHDPQALAKLKPADPSDPKAATAFYTEVGMIDSVLESRQATDIVQQSISLKPQVDNKQISREDVLEMTKAKLVFEVSHLHSSQSAQLDEYIEELETFELPESVGIALDDVLELYGERTAKISMDFVTQAMGMSTSFSADTASWARDWDKALEALRIEIERDLKSL